MLMPLPPRRRAGFSLVETATAMGLVGIFISVLIGMSSNILGLLRSARDNASASQVLQARVEQIRTGNWLQVTNPDFLVTHVLEDSESTSGLGGAIETITISAHPPNVNVPPAKIVCQAGAMNVTARNLLLKDQRMVRIDVSLTWKGTGKHPDHTRATTALISRAASNKK